MTGEQLLAQYARPHTWDEMMGPDAIREPYRSLLNAIGQLSVSQLQQKDLQAGRHAGSQQGQDRDPAPGFVENVGFAHDVQGFLYRWRQGFGGKPSGNALRHKRHVRSGLTYRSHDDPSPRLVSQGDFATMTLC